MKKINYFITTMSIISLILISGCSKTELYGENLSGNTPITTVKQILDNPAEFENKTITLKGEIKEVCPSGCWFFISDNSGELYVNIGPSGFAIPQKAGAKASVEGELITHNGTQMLMGKGVEIK